MTELYDPDSAHLHHLQTSQNPLLIKDTVGKARIPYQDLPPAGHTYGGTQRAGRSSTAEALRWHSHEPSSPQQASRSDDLWRSRREKSLQSFRDLDIGRDGYLDYNEMRTLLKRGNPHISEKDMKIIYKEIDYNRDGKIDFEEFYDYLHNDEGVGDIRRNESRPLRHTTSSRGEEQRRERYVRASDSDDEYYNPRVGNIWAEARKERYQDMFNDYRGMFNDLDMNGDNRLDFYEMARMLRAGNPDISDKHLRRLFYDLDYNNDGKIDFGEFYDYLYNETGEHGSRREQMERNRIFKEQEEEIRRERATTRGRGGGHRSVLDDSDPRRVDSYEEEIMSVDEACKLLRGEKRIHDEIRRERAITRRGGEGGHIQSNPNFSNRRHYDDEAMSVDEACRKLRGETKVPRSAAQGNQRSRSGDTQRKKETPQPTFGL